MHRIINIFHLSAYLKNTPLYIAKQTAYFEFCDFIKNSSKIIYGKDATPYELEMLLFTLADNEIFTELQKQLKITTSNPDSLYHQ